MNLASPSDCRSSYRPTDRSAISKARILRDSRSECARGTVCDSDYSNFGGGQTVRNKAAILKRICLIRTGVGRWISLSSRFAPGPGTSESWNPLRRQKRRQAPTVSSHLQASVQLHSVFARKITSICNDECFRECIGRPSLVHSFDAWAPALGGRAGFASA